MSYVDMLVTDTIAGAVGDNAGEEGRAVGSHDSIEGDVIDEADDTSHAAFVHCLVGG